MSDFDYVQQRWIEQFKELDRQIVQEAVLCQIWLLDPAVIERVLQNDTLVCGTKNPAAFAKLRSLAMIHFSLRDKAVVALGQQETMRTWMRFGSGCALTEATAWGPGRLSTPAIRRRAGVRTALPKKGTVAGKPQVLS